MVQSKTKLSHVDTLRGKTHKAGTPMTERARAPRAVHKPDARTHKTTAAIKNRIESLMVGRLVHEGGTLAVVPKPETVEQYDKSGARTTDKQNKEIFAASMARRARMKREGTQLPDIGGATASKAVPVAGQKRKRGLEGITKRGDDWFDAQDADIEAIRWSSDDSGIDDDNEAGSDHSDTPQPAPVAPQFAELDEDKVIDDESNGDAEKTDAAANAGSSSSDTKRASKKSSSSESSAPTTNDDAATLATKRGKSLLGGWFNARSTKDQARRQAASTKKSKSSAAKSSV